MLAASVSLLRRALVRQRAAELALRATATAARAAPASNVSSVSGVAADFACACSVRPRYTARY